MPPFHLLDPENCGLIHSYEKWALLWLAILLGMAAFFSVQSYRSINAAKIAIDALTDKWKYVARKWERDGINGVVGSECAWRYSTKGSDIELRHGFLPELIGGGAKQAHGWGLQLPQRLPQAFMILWIIIAFVTSAFVGLHRRDLGCSNLPGQSSELVKWTAPAEGAQTQTLRHRLESLRNSNPAVSLSFTGLNQAFAVSLRPEQLRQGACTYVVDKNTSGLIDILLGADVRVGSPAGAEAYQGEARFGVYIAADSPEGLDLWFTNPLTFPSHEQWVVGHSQDRGETSIYKIMAEPTLRSSLWDWAHANGHPRPSNAAECLEIEKYDSPHKGQQ